MKSPAIEIKGLWVSYQQRPALRDVTLRIKPSQIVGIMGPNGAGKSTLLKGMLGLVPADRGTVKIFGKELKKNRHRISYVPQSGSVDWDFPVIVEEVVMMARYHRIGWLRKPQANDRRAVSEALKRVEMDNLAKRQIGQLSGGQKQRVFLARAIAQQADIVLLDEPFVGVDAKTEHTIKRILKEMKTAGKVIMVVNHDFNDVVGLFDSLILLNQHIVAYGRTKKVFTQEFITKAYGSRGAVPFERLETTK